MSFAKRRKIMDVRELERIYQEFDESYGDFYDTKGLYDSLENDGISSEEEGFMIGYLGA